MFHLLLVVTFERSELNKINEIFRYGKESRRLWEQNGKEVVEILKRRSRETPLSPAMTLTLFSNTRQSSAFVYSACHISAHKRIMLHSQDR